MADNIPVTAGVGTSVATDEIGGAHYQRVKVTFGVDGAAADVSASTPLPVAIQGALGAVSISNFPATQPISGTVGVSGSVAVTGTFWQATQPVSGTVGISGTVPVSGPLTDTELRASALPVSGTFWQATQPVSAASLPLPTGAATQTTLASLEALLTTLSDTIKNHNAPFIDGTAGQVILGKRRDSDSTLVADGDLNTFNMDEEGRLKVASKPASYADITGDITAVQATIGTPVAGGTVSGDVSRASNIMAFCTGTFAGVNVTFEGSLQDTGDTNWFGIQAVRTNANTIETATGALSAQPVYGWEMSVNALARVRVRATARTSGTQTWRFKQGTYATEPIPAAQATATQPVSGTVTATVTAGTVNPVVPATPYFLNSAATTNGALIITGTSGLQAFYATNEGASVAYVKLYNKATAPTVGTDVPEMIIPVPAALAGLPGVAEIPIGFSGFRFALGLGIAITRNAVFSDTTAIGAGEVKVKLSRTI